MPSMVPPPPLTFRKQSTKTGAQFQCCQMQYLTKALMKQILLERSVWCALDLSIQGEDWFHAVMLLFATSAVQEYLLGKTQGVHCAGHQFNKPTVNYDF